MDSNLILGRHMAVAPGNKIAQPDMAALAQVANIKTSAIFNVSPLYLDGSGNPYGHKEFSNVAVIGGGGGYKRGDVLTLGYGSQYEVAMISSAGAVIGIRVINNGAGQYNDNSPAISGGSGSGCVLSYGWAQVGPTMPYSFPDFILNSGVVTSIFMVSGGSGYKAGDVLTTDLSGLAVAVNTVDGSGKILTYTASGWTATTIPADIAAMNASGGSGSGAVFGGYFTLNKNPDWLTELNRLREGVAAVVGTGGDFIHGNFTAAQTYCSGPWPKSGFTSNAYDANSSAQAIFYEDTGSPVTITYSSSCTMGNGGTNCYSYGLSYWGCQGTNIWGGGITGTIDYFGFQGITQIEYRVIIKSPPGATLSGTFAFNATKVNGTTNYGFNGTDFYYGDVPTLTVDSNLGTFTPVLTGQGYQYQCTIGSVIPDGEYYIRVTGGYISHCAPGVSYVYASLGPLDAQYNGEIQSAYGEMDSASATYAQLTETIWSDPCSTLWNYCVVGQGINDVDPSSTGLSFSGTFSTISFGPGTSAPGIDSTKNVLVIPFPNLSADPFLGRFGVYLKTQNVITAPAQPVYSNFPRHLLPGMIGPITLESAGTQPVFGGIEYFAGTFSATISQPVSGYWIGTTPMVSSLNPTTAGQMPWNNTIYGQDGGAQNPMLTGHAVGERYETSSYNQSLPTEQQPDPPSWVPYDNPNGVQTAIYYAVGNVIVDSNGNWQTAIVGGNGGEVVNPAWATVEGQTTKTGNVIWKCTRVMQTSNVWLPNTVKTLGYAVKDSNGNTQVVTSAGTSGGTAPAWNTKCGGKTVDGGVTWTMRSPIVSAPRRMNVTPRYPVVWYSETVAALKTPVASTDMTIWGAGSQWQTVNNFNMSSTGWQTSNAAKGWFIYSVSINRIQQFPQNISGDGTVIGAGDGSVGAGDGGVGADGGATADTTGISVTIGCIRNGSFVAFGTYLTGQTIQVLWPIFTSDPLVYQCSERVEIQAVAIASGGAGVTRRTDIAGGPVCAAHFLDTFNLLQLIP
jgi:hypothetical protein